MSTTMPVRVAVAATTCPPSRPPSNPFVASVTLGWAWYHKIIVRTPAGHNGWTGYQFRWNNAVIAPWSYVPGQGLYHIANDEIDEWPIDQEMDTNVQVAMINTDIYTHTIYIRYFYTPISLVTPDIAASNILAIV